jgi:alpha-ketoglutarate-dependent taurine dioxygenase
MAPSPQQSTGTNTYVEVVPLTLHIGAEIRGVDLSKPLPPEQLKEVRDAFLKWKVVFFRGQNLDHAQHVAMARQFGGPTTCSICWSMRSASSSGEGDSDRVSHPKRIDASEENCGKLRRCAQRIAAATANPS